MIFFHNRKENRQNYPKLIFLNAFIKVEASFLQFDYNYSILLIKSGIFHSTGSNRTVGLTGAKGSSRITLITNAGPGGYFSAISKKHLLYSLFVKRIIAIESQLYLLGLVGL